MDPSTLAATDKKPSRWWVLVTALAGAVGALTAIAAAGTGTYDVAPFRIELRAAPALLGKTELAVRTVENFVPSHAEAGTHAAPMRFRATIVEASTSGLIAADRRVATTPHDFATFMAEEGKSAINSFAFKLIGLAVAGAAAGGAAVSLGRWRRIPGAVLAGVLTFAVIGLMIQQTYDKSEFLKTRYVLDARDGPTGPLPAP